MKDSHPQPIETVCGRGGINAGNGSSRKRIFSGITKSIHWLGSCLRSLLQHSNVDAARSARYDSFSGEFDDALLLWTDKLTDLNRSTEQEFLSVGRMLQLHYQQAKNISTTCSSIVDLMKGEDMNGAIRGLQVIRDRVRRIESECKESAEVLHRIMEKLASAEKVLEGFRNIVRSLNLLCVSTRIENARTSQIDTGFDALSDDIRKLAVSIEEKLFVTKEECKSLKVSILQALQRVSDVASTRRSQSELILNRIGSNLDSLNRKYEFSSTLAEGISAKYRDISGSIGEIVGSMQFHDITRQRFEHIGKAFGELIQSIGTLEKADVGKVCELQMLQLVQTRDLLIQAVQSIVQNLQNTSQTIRQVSEETLCMTGTTNQAEESFLSNIEAELSSIASVLSEYSLINRELRHATRSAAEKTAGVSAFVNDIEKIGLGVKLIALNAVVRAAHIGEDGKALSTLAEAIHHLSGDAGLLAGEVSEVFTSIASTAQELSAVRTSAHDGEADDSNRLEEKMKSLTDCLNRADAEVASRVKLMKESSSVLAGQIEQGIRKMAVQDEVTAVVDEITSGLSRFAGCARAQPTSESLPHGKKLLESLELSYTMDSERLAHRQHLSSSMGLDSAESSASMKSVSFLGSANDRDNEEEELGDNVELF